MLDKLLVHIDVHVDYFSLCLVAAGWRLHLPGPPDVMLHFVLRGLGAVRGPAGRAWPLAPRWLAIVPRELPTCSSRAPTRSVLGVTM